MSLGVIKNTIMAGCVGIVALFAATANATVDLGILGTSNELYGGEFISGTGIEFDHDYSFSVNPAVTSASLITIAWDESFSDFSEFTPILSAFTYDSGDQPALTPFVNNNETSFAIMAPVDYTEGYYKLHIHGVTSGAAGGAYTLKVSAVPLPAAAWLFISAFFVIGGMSYFKRKREDKDSFPLGALTA